MKIFNHKSTKEKRKLLRQAETEAERKLWEIIRAKRLGGNKFFRQYGVGHYITDFYCPEHMLAIEVDGSGHYSKDGMEYDKERQIFFSAINVRTLRFSNQEVLQNMEAVKKQIEAALS